MENTAARVLIADDERETLEAEAKLVEATGHTVIGKAASGEEACRLADLLNPDLVLLDMKMPDMDGLEAAAKIVEKRPVPIVLCTAYCDEEVVARAREVGVYGYVNKPFRIKDLMCAIDAARSRYEDTMNLKNDVRRLESEIESRKLVEKAKGIVMKSKGLDEEQAHRYLQRESQRLSKPLGELARAVIMADSVFSGQ